MNTQHGTRNNAKPTGNPALGFGFIFLLCGALQGVVGVLGHFLGCLAGQFLPALPGFLMIIVRALGAHLLELERVPDCYRLLACVFPVAHCLFVFRGPC